MLFLSDKSNKEKFFLSIYKSIQVFGKILRKSEFVTELITSDLRIFLDNAALENQFNDELLIFMEKILLNVHMEQVFFKKVVLRKKSPKIP